LLGVLFLRKRVLGRGKVCSAFGAGGDMKKEKQYKELNTIRNVNYPQK